MTPAWIGWAISGVTCYGSVIYNCVAVKAGNHGWWEVMMVWYRCVMVYCHQMPVKSIYALFTCVITSLMRTLLDSWSGLYA